jgi:hypothetical protein
MAQASTLSLLEWDGVDPYQGLLRPVTIASGHLNGERNSPSVADQMGFAAQLGSISRVRSRLELPKTARVELPSTTARDQSISS